MAQGHSLNVYTDSEYAFHILLFHSAVWKECGILTTKGGSIANSGYIMASHLPKAIGIIHCQSHQTDSSVISRGNNRADEVLQPSKAQIYLT
ncbi:RNase H family protein, partial [Escherichia coli]